MLSASTSTFTLDIHAQHSRSTFTLNVLEGVSSGRLSKAFF